MTFWILISLLILVVLAVLSRPLLLAARGSADDGGSLNLSVYRQQLQELAADHERGLVSEDQMQKARRDIERALLNEVPEQTQSVKEPDKGGWVPVILVAALVIAVSVPVYLHIGHPEGLRPPAPGLHGTPSVNEMVASLERRLERNPNDTEGWLMLARSYMVQERYRDAAGVLERLRGMVGDEPGLLVRYANALALANGGRFEGKPAALIQEVLKQDPDHPSAMWFAGLAANQRGDYQKAIDYWERLQPKLENEPEALERLQNMIARARNAIEPGSANPPREDERSGEAAVTVRISLAPGLKERVQPDDALFVFARAAEGPAMPLAVEKHRAGDLPMEVRLDDSDAMTPAGKLSNHDSIVLVARIAKSGGVRAVSGDLQGRRTGVALPPAEPVELVIDTIVP